MRREIHSAVARKLGHYAYLYVNPLDDTVFYVGKGKGRRALAHLDDVDKVKVRRVLRRIRAAGKEPRIEILAHGLPSAEAALRVEAAEKPDISIWVLQGVLPGSCIVGPLGWRARKRENAAKNSHEPTSGAWSH
jgi:hypothetical protein